MGTSSRPAGDRPPVDELLKSGPIRRAFALIESGRPGCFYAVELTNVYAEGVEYLHKNGTPEKPLFGISRVITKMEERKRRGLL